MFDGKGKISQVMSKYRTRLILCVLAITAVFVGFAGMRLYKVLEQDLYHNILQVKQDTFKDSVEDLKKMIDFQRSTMRSNHPDWTEEQIKENVTAMLRDYLYSCQYSDESYMWIQEIKNYEGGDGYAIRLIHPNLKDTEGCQLSTNTDDGMGRLPYKEELDGINKDGYVYLNYQFKKLHSEEIGEKITYSSLYKDYNWIISRGVTLSEVSEITDKIKKHALVMIAIITFLYAVFVLIILKYANELTKKTEQLNVAEKQLEEEVKIANEANQAKTSFLFNMSHDIRTPMNAIIGFRTLLEKDQDNPEKRKHYLEKIDESSQVLLSIINNVLEMSRIEKGTLILDETESSIDQLFDGLFSVFGEMMEQKKLKYTTQINVEHHFIWCDLAKLREVFINIISNAYKYTKSGGSITVSVEELPCAKEGWSLYQTTIKDTGIGMSEEFLPHLFEEFSREQNTTIRQIEGTGLGMPIVKRLVEFLQGKIEVMSKQGIGTTFVVTIPHRWTEQKRLIEHTVVAINLEMFKGKRILLAEDNAINAEIAQAILSEDGFLVDHAEDGSKCVEMLSAAPPHYYDLILMDIQMPNMTGYEATERIRALADKEKATIPIIAMTANAFEEDRKEAFRVGMNGHVAKPIDIHKLLKELARVLQ